MAQQPPYAPNTVNQTVSYGGATWKGNPGGAWTLQGADGSSGGTGASVGNAIDTAKQLRQFNIESNQPQVQSLQSSVDPLKDRYSKILDSIKGNQQVAENRQTLTTANELGRRGISNDSGLYQQELTNAVNPVTQGYAGLSAQTELGQTQDLNSIAQQIAALQSGNPDSALSGALNILGQQQQADQFAQNLTLQQQQNAEQTRQFNAASAQKNYQTLGEGQTLYDPTTGKAIYTAPKSYQPQAPGIDLSKILQLLNPGVQTNSVPSSFQSITSQTQFEKEARARSKQLYG